MGNNLTAHSIIIIIIIIISIIMAYAQNSLILGNECRLYQTYKNNKSNIYSEAWCTVDFYACVQNSDTKH